MNIFLTRNSGWYGKLALLDLLCNGRRLASLREKESISVRLELTDIPATLHLRMQNMVGSPTIHVPNVTSDLHLECGAERWTLLDFFNLQFLPSLNDKVFYFRKIVPK